MNVANCVEYLRSVNVDVSDSMAESWGLSEQVHRYLRREKGWARKGQTMECVNGHEHFAVIDRKHRKSRHPCCHECGGPWEMISLVWMEARDGTVRDFRPKGDRWKPLPVAGDPGHG